MRSKMSAPLKGSRCSAAAEAAKARLKAEVVSRPTVTVMLRRRNARRVEGERLAVKKLFLTGDAKSDFI
jgi:hypothetical protein